MPFSRYEREFINYLTLNLNLRPNTLKGHRTAFKQLKAWFKNKSFNLANSETFLVNKRAGGASAGYLQQFIFTIRVFSDFLVKKGELKENFSRQIPLPKRQRKLPNILSCDEIEAVLDVTRIYKRGRNKMAPELKPFWDLLLGLLAKTGCRVSEILNLKVEDIDFANSFFKIRESKTGEQRFVPTPPDLISALKKHTLTKEPTENVFVSFRGKKLYGCDVGRELRLRAEIAGIKKRVYPHLLRHSFITELLRQDVSVMKVAQIVGHAKVATTQQYTHLIIKDLQKAILRHPLIRKHRKPEEILQSIKETFEGLKIQDDPRFKYQLTETSDSVSIDISLRKNPIEN